MDSIASTKGSKASTFDSADSNATAGIGSDNIRTASTRGILIPQHLDALPWSNWHTRFVLALGVTWLLDGLEGSLGGSLAGALKSQQGLSLSDSQLGLSSSFYLLGAVAGALILGNLADRFGRRRVFFWTLLCYLISTAATGASWNLASFTFFRFLTGAGIGGEYSAVNSMIGELVPARVRGRVDLAINGTFWLGILMGSVVSGVCVSGRPFPPTLGWRVAFLSGIPIGITVLFIRRSIPESPRWLLNKGRVRQAQLVLAEIEGRAFIFESSIPQGTTQMRTGFFKTIGQLRGAYGRRALVSLTLMTAQALLYNSVFFSLTLVLMRYYGTDPSKAGYVFVPIAIANLIGPILLGKLFDTLGRRTMTGGCFVLSGLALLLSGLLFNTGWMTAREQIAMWCVVFFFASASASAAYLGVSELFPQEVRASTISLFYATGTVLGGVSGPLIFGRLIGSGSRGLLVLGYAFGSVAMIVAGLIQATWGVSAERRSLESLALS